MSMYHNYKQSITVLITIALTAIFASCSQTKSIPEGEYLYTGIKEIAYGHRWGEKKKKRSKDEGVITAVANAYDAVEDVFTGKVPTSITPTPATLTPQERDSLLAVQRQEATVYSAAKREIQGVLAYAPNGSIMGSSQWVQPITPGLWIWNQYTDSHTLFGRWMLNTFGTSPVLMSNVNPRIRTQVALNTLHNFGYFHAKADYRIEETKHPRKQKVSYQILPGELFRFGTISYQGFTGAADSIIRHTMPQRHLHEGAPFSLSSLNDERVRIGKLLRNNGYYFFRNDYITYKADTLQHPLTAQLQVLPTPAMPDFAQRPYHIGRTNITVYKYGNHELTDSLTLRNITMRWSGGKAKRPPLRLRALIRYLHMRKGSLYSEEAHTTMQDQIAAMGIFSTLQLDFVPRHDTDTLDIHLTTTLDKPYTSEFEAKITNKTNGLLGPGLSYTVHKKNAFRGAETLSASIYGSYEWQTGANIRGDKSVINSWTLGGNIDLSYPRFMFFGIGKRLNRHTISTTSFKADFKWMNRALYYSSASVGVRAKWTFQKGRNILHEFTPIHLEFSRLLSTTTTFDSIANQNPALWTSLKDKLVPSMEYTFTWTGGDESRHTQRVTAFTKQALQFQKYTLEYAHNFRLSERQRFVMRAFLGILWNYGSKSAPYADLFSVGGANSIRAFGVRTIGPGSYHPENSSYSYLNQVGDAKFEFNLEYRFPIVGNLYGATFIDTGNTWLMRQDPTRPGGTLTWRTLGDQLALGTGVGLRYDLDVLVIRFDLGVGIHAPYDTGRTGYYNMPSFGKSLGYHLAIGYPF